MSVGYAPIWIKKDGAEFAPSIKCLHEALSSIVVFFAHSHVAGNVFRPASMTFNNVGCRNPIAMLNFIGINPHLFGKFCLLIVVHLKNDAMLKIVYATLIASPNMRRANFNFRQVGSFVFAHPLKIGVQELLASVTTKKNPDVTIRVQTPMRANAMPINTPNRNQTVLCSLIARS